MNDTSIRLGELAPHADKKWVEAFILELRLRDVPGDRIGDALTTVEAHLVDTGESVQEAFGPAKEYARSLGESEPADARISGGFVAAILVGLAGLVITPRAFTALLEGRPLGITAADVVGAVILLALVAVVLAVSDRLLRFVLERQVAGVVAAMVVFMAVTGLFVTVFALWDGPIASVSAGLGLAVGLVALAIGTIMQWRSGGDDDLVRTPTGRTLGTPWVLRVLRVAAMPFFAALLCLVSWLLWRLG